MRMQNSDEICKLLFSIIQINVVYTYSYCHLTNKDININIEGLVTLILAKLWERSCRI